MSYASLYVGVSVFVVFAGRISIGDAALTSSCARVGDAIKNAIAKTQSVVFVINLICINGPDWNKKMMSEVTLNS